MVLHSTRLLEACPTGQAIHLGILFYKSHYDHFTNSTFAWAMAAMDCIVEDGPIILMHKQSQYEPLLTLQSNLLFALPNTRMPMNVKNLVDFDR